MTRVSVVMPVYNAQRTLAKSIESVLAQTFTDLELIIVDDGSMDRSRAIYSTFADKRIKVITQENRGLPGARNTGIRHAEGDYIAFIDSDDLWEPDKLEVHVAHLDGVPDVGVSYSDSTFIDNNGTRLGVCMNPKLREITPADILCRNPVGNGSAPVVRREVFEQIAYLPITKNKSEIWYFDETFRYLEDVECWMRIALLTKWRFEGIDRPLTIYRIAPDGLSANADKMYVFWRRMLAKVHSIAPEIANSFGDRARAYQLRYYARRAVQAGDWKAARQQIKAALKLYPKMALEEPWRTAITVGAIGAGLVLPHRIYRGIERCIIRLMPALASAR